MGIWDRIRRWVTDGVGAGEAGAVEALDRAAATDVIPPLLEALRSPRPTVVRAAASALRKLGPDALAAVPELAQAGARPMPTDGDQVQAEYARSDALYALGDLLAHLEPLRRKLGRPTRRDRPDGEAPSALDLLLAATADPDAGVRALAWSALRVYADEPLVRHTALECLDDPDANVRRNLVAAITPGPR